MSNDDPFDIVETEKTLGTTFEIVQYKTLKGSDDLNVAEKVFSLTKPIFI